MGKQTGRDVRGGSKKLLRVAGPPAVSALFAVALERVERLFFEARMKPYISAFCAELARRRLPYRLVDAEELERIAGAVMHGGIVAVAQPRPVPVLDATKCAQWAARSGLLLLLDGVGNPHNLGAIARTAVFFGIERMMLSNHPAQAGPSDSSYRVAEGGLEHVELYRARHFARALMECARITASSALPLSAGSRSRRCVPTNGRSRWCWATRSKACRLRRSRPAKSS
jgi:RNA methyltransferase, TrmH family